MSALKKLDPSRIKEQRIRMNGRESRRERPQATFPMSVHRNFVDANRQYDGPLRLVPEEPQKGKQAKPNREV